MLNSRLVLDVAVFGRRGTDLATIFGHRLTGEDEYFGYEFLADRYCHLTAPLSSNQAASPHIEKTD